MRDLKINVWAADLAEIKSLSSENENVKYLLCMIDAFTKPLKEKKGKTVLNAFIEILNRSNRIPNKGPEFYNKLMQEWLENHDILMY